MTEETRNATSADEVSGHALGPTIRAAIEVAIRLGTIFLLVIACLVIVAPFVSIVVWALIIAIAVDAPFESLSRKLGDRRVLTATLSIVAVLAILLVPTVRLSASLATGAQTFAQNLNNGEFQVPPPDPRVEDWPVVGPRIYSNWKLASVNLSEALQHLEPQLQAVSRALLSAAGSVGAGLLQMVGALLISGVMLVRGPQRRQAIESFATRMAGEARGPRLANLANATVKSVVQGILGVALFQAVLAGGGFIAAGVPAAGLWAMLVLVAAIVQLPVALVMIPPIVFAISSIGGLTAVVLTIWCVGVALLDNVLKPILFGRGVEVPSLVIFMGAIGGMLSLGFIGLFLGAVVLALGFALFMAWLSDGEESELSVSG